MLNLFDDAVTMLERWCNGDLERNYELTKSVRRNHWETPGAYDGELRHTCEVWCPRHGAASGSGRTEPAAALAAVMRFQESFGADAGSASAIEFHRLWFGAR